MSNFRDFKAKNKLKGANNKPSFVDFGTGEIGNSSLEILLKQARKSGSLNLANRNLNSVPKEVYKINSVPLKEDGNIKFGENDGGWWENVYLLKLILVANSINQIDEDINLLNNLTYLDISDNKIHSFQTAICELNQLRHLNIGKNMIVSLPDNINKLCLLQQFLCAQNRITNVPDLSTMADLETLDISKNNLSTFPPCIANLVSLRRLDLSHNQIPSMPFPLEKSQGLRFLDLSHNKLSVFSGGLSSHVEQIYLHVNRLATFPIVYLQSNLKELSVTHNQIKTLTEDNISNIPNITTLSIANNLIAELPEKINNLTLLVNLDVSNNELKSLPFSLGDMNSLKSLSIEGNPFRAMKRTVIGAGTEVIKEYLRIRNTESNDKDSVVAPGIPALGRAGGDSGYLDQADLRATGVLRLSSRGFTIVPEDIFTSIQTFAVKEILLNKNKLTSFPMRIFACSESLLDLDLSNNNLTELPPSIDTLRHIRRLNISNNQIGTLPQSLANLDSLIHLAMSYNPLGTNIPDVVYRCGNIQTLHMSHCGLVSLDPLKIKAMSSLEVLDVSNNDITSVPAELGLCEKIKSLNLDGNSFKVPRVAVLAKGTVAVMEYLKSRIVPDK